MGAEAVMFNTIVNYWSAGSVPEAALCRSLHLKSLTDLTTHSHRVCRLRLCSNAPTKQMVCLV